MPEPDPQRVLASVADLISGLETMTQGARTSPAPVWRVVEELLEGQVHSFRGLQRLLEAVVESGGPL
jgi:hypothetical protein